MASTERFGLRKYDRSSSGMYAVVACTWPPITEIELEKFSGITAANRARARIEPGPKKFVSSACAWAKPPESAAMNTQDVASALNMRSPCRHCLAIRPLGLTDET